MSQAASASRPAGESAPVATLEGWVRHPFRDSGYDCYEKGSGPGVVLIPEVPGITPEVLGLAQYLVELGFTVVVPSPFGTPGRAATPGYTVNTVLRLCVSREMRAFAHNAHRPITDFLRAVATDLAGRTPGRGVGVIGMCFTGGFALATAVDDVVLAPVLAEPAVPLPLGRTRRADAGVSEKELERIAQRTRDDGLCVLGLRFSEDAYSPGERFATLKERFGDAFTVIQLDSSRGNPDGYSPRAHSVLTDEVRETPPNSAVRARAQVAEFLRERIA